VVHSRQRLQVLERVWFLTLDPRKTYIFQPDCVTSANRTLSTAGSGKSVLRYVIYQPLFFRISEALDGRLAQRSSGISMASVMLAQDTSRSSFSTLRTQENKMRALSYPLSSSNLAIDLLAFLMFSMAFIPLTEMVNNNPTSVRLVNASRTCSRSQKNYPSTLSSMQSMSAPTRLGYHRLVIESWLF
jgi:hypothetical protein